MRMDPHGEADFVPNFDRRMVPVLGPFTALSAEGGLRPGIHAGLGERRLFDRRGALSATFTRLLLGWPQEPGEPG